jgi:hypothetical protein
MDQVQSMMRAGERYGGAALRCLEEHATTPSWFAK